MGLLDKTETKEFTDPMKIQGRSDSSIGNFFKSLKNRMGIGSPERNAADTYERGMRIVPNCLAAIKNEVPVKQYTVAVMRNLFKFERAEARIQITTKRVILRAAGRSVGGRTILQHEFAIDEIAGIEARRNNKFSFIHLIFALLIVFFANMIISSSVPGISSRISPFSLYQYRISRIMSPSHVNKARADEAAAITQRKQAEEKLPPAEANLKKAQTAEEKAIADTQNGILKTRRVSAGRDWWGNTIYKTESYRDKSPAGLKEAQDNLNSATAVREKADKEAQDVSANIETAKTNEANAIHKRVLTENVWKVSMTILGILLGFGALLPFFMLYKKFGLKLLILNLSIFGFTLALAASGFAIWKLFIVISEIITLVCIFLFCFRPNLIISIKNNGVKAAIDICRDTLFTRNNENRTGFTEIIPTDEAEDAIRKIGAYIGNIQKLGDSGQDKGINKQSVNGTAGQK